MMLSCKSIFIHLTFMDLLFRSRTACKICFFYVSPWEDIKLTANRLNSEGEAVSRAHVSAPLVERTQLQWSFSEAGPPDGISVAVPTFDPLNVDQYLISLVSFVSVLNNPHSQKNSEALADPHLSKVTAEQRLLLMHTVDKFMKKCARSHLMY